jgi:hypothetical protein
MGLSLSCGSVKMRTSTGWLVIGWCGGANHSPEGKSPDYGVWRDTIGTVEIPADVVREANDRVPLDYNVAVFWGEYVDEHVVSEKTFTSARQFLAKAAIENKGIWGSY